MAVDKALPGYPTSGAGKKFIMLHHYGPSSYNTTTGDVLYAKQLGYGGIDWVASGKTLTVSHSYEVQPSWATTSGPDGHPYVILRWFTAGSTETTSTTNLASEAVDLLLIVT